MKSGDYVLVLKPGHPLATGVGCVGEHRLKLYEKIGEGDHRCHWCGTPLRWGRSTHKGSLIVDHLDGNPSNNDIANLVPSCHFCNITRSEKHLCIKPGELFTVKGGRKFRAIERECQRCGSKFLHPAFEKRPDRGRFCSQQCGAKGRANVWITRRANMEKGGQLPTTA